MPQYIEDELWGLHLAPHKTYSQEVEMPFRVSMAALGAKLESQERCSVFVRVDDIEYVLCSLTPSALEQQLLNHTFVLGEKITFYTNGENAIHLTGNFLTLDEEFDEGHPIDLNTDSEEDDEDMDEDEEMDEDDEEFDSEMDEEITSEEDQDGEQDEEQDSDAEFNSEDEDDPKIKELTPEEEKQLVADVNKKIKELKSKREQSEDDEDDISVDEDLSFDDEDEDDEDDEEEDEDEDDSDFDSELDEEDFDEDDSEDDSQMGSEEDEPVVVKNDKRMNTKTSAPEAKKLKVEVKETPKKETPKQPATATPKEKETPKPTQAKDTPKQPAAAAAAAAVPKVATPAAKENQATDANKQPQQQPSNKPVSKTLPSGLKMEDLKVGDGMKVKPGRKVAIVYKGSLTNGKVFDSNKTSNPLEFVVGKGDVVKGLEMGVQGMALNGTRRITIPAPLAYGAKELPGIPKNSTLVFDVTIQSVSGK